MLSEDLYSVFSSEINTYFYEAMKIKVSKCVSLLGMCMLTQEEVLAELEILENDDPLGD